MALHKRTLGGTAPPSARTAGEAGGPTGIEGAVSALASPSGPSSTIPVLPLQPLASDATVEGPPLVCALATPIGWSSTIPVPAIQPTGAATAVEGPPLVHAMATPIARSQTIPVLPIQPLGSPGRRRLAIAGGAGLAVLALRAPRVATIQPTTADAPPAHTAGVATVQPTTARQTVASRQAINAAPAVRAPRLQFARPAPPVQAETPRAAPDAAAIAQLYGSIGRGLKRLDQTHGLDATFDLWPRYRMIRINDAIASAEVRVRAQELLEDLELEIAARSR